MRSLVFFLVVAIGQLVQNPVSAQDVPAKLMSFGKAVGSSYKVSNKGKILIVEGYREGKQVKEERINVFDLDVESIRYNEVDNAVSVQCFAETDGCVEQRLLLDRKKDFRKRLVFGLDGAEPAEVEKTLRELLTEMCKTY